MSDKFLIPLCIIALLLFLFDPFFNDDNTEGPDPIACLSEIENMDISLNAEYGMYVEEALSILECYLLEDEDDYYPVSEQELENAYSVVSSYYFDTKEIASEFMRHR